MIGTMGAWNSVLYFDSEANWEVINKLISSKDSLVLKQGKVQNENGAISKSVIEFDNEAQGFKNKVADLDTGNKKLAVTAEAIAKDNIKITSDINSLKSFKIET